MLCSILQIVEISTFYGPREPNDANVGDITLAGALRTCFRPGVLCHSASGPRKSTTGYYPIRRRHVATVKRVSYGSCDGVV